MKLQWIYHSVTLLALFAMVQMSPISVANKMTTTRRNNVEDLFLISEKEEQQFDDESLDSAVIEKIKARILKSLHLKSPPKSHPPVPSLQTLYSRSNLWKNDMVSGSQESVFQHSESEFLTSEIVPNTCFDRTGQQCLRFQIKIPKYLADLNDTFVELWLHKKSRVTEYKIAQLSDEPNNPNLKKEIFDVYNQTEQSGWTRFDATGLLSQSINILDLEVFSESSVNLPIDFGKDKQPFLVVRSAQNNRLKRAAGDCDEENSTCCRKKVYVSFKDIGWDDWVVQPEGYNANICKGSCRNRLDLADRHHAHVLIRLMSTEGSNYSEVFESIHCTPKTYKPLSIIYTDEKGLKVISNLPDMSVSECSCS